MKLSQWHLCKHYYNTFKKNKNKKKTYFYAFYYVGERARKKKTTKLSQERELDNWSTQAYLHIRGPKLKVPRLPIEALCPNYVKILEESKNVM